MFKKISILGVVLLIASVAVAAFLPGKNKKAQNGHLYAGNGVNTSVGTFTCSGPGQDAINCHDTQSEGPAGTSSGGITTDTTDPDNNTTGNDFN